MKKYDAKPPFIAEWILKKLSHREEDFSNIGDFEEMFDFYAKKDGIKKANKWYIKQVFTSTPRLILMKTLNNITLTKNYLKVAYRNIIKRKLSSFINIAGLSIGIASSMIILLHIVDETNYESGYPNAENIYRIQYIEDGEDSKPSAATAPLLAESMKAQFSEIDNIFRVVKTSAMNYTISNGEDSQKAFNEPNGIYSEPSLINALDLNLLSGDRETALDVLFSIMISDELSKKYFGNNDPIEKLIKSSSGKVYTITGVFEDINFNTHLKFDFIISYNTWAKLIYDQRERLGANMLLQKHWRGLYTYASFKNKNNLETAKSKTRKFLDEFLLSQTNEENIPNYRLSFDPIKSIHLNSHLDEEFSANGEIMNIYIFSIIGFLIIIIACANFVNLSTAMGLKRFREIGLRKVLGANKHQLIRQYLFEAYIVTFVSGVFGFSMFAFSLEFYNNFANKSFELMSLLTPELIFYYFVSILLLGFVAGIYPSIYMTKFEPVESIKGDLTKDNSSSYLKKGLLIFQFCISITLIFSTLIIYNQMQFIKEKDLGFNVENIVSVKVGSINELDNASTFNTFKNELMRNPNIKSVGLASNMPGSRLSSEGLITDENVNDDNIPVVKFLRVDKNFIKTMGIEVVEGRDFRSNTTGISFILNETARDVLGFRNYIGVNARTYWKGEGEIVGVVKDFNYNSLHDVLEPIVLELHPEWTSNLLVNIESNIPETLSYIEETISKIAPNNIFNYKFVEENLAELYENDQRMESLFKVFASLAIFISCLGLFGLASFTTELKIKEIGVRKVLGASLSNIIFNISSVFFKWITIAIVIAIPLGYYLMNNWLNNFAYRINIGILSIIISIGLSLIAAAAAVGYQSIKAAYTNPVDSLRYE